MTTTKTSMRVAFMPTNQTWVVAWGLSLIDIDHVKLWPERSDLVRALQDKGMSVGRDGAISIERSLAAQGGTR